jgi:hypothetical protein
MTAAQKIQTILTIDEFEKTYADTKCQFHEGEVWEAQATTPDHSHLQLDKTRECRNAFHPHHRRCRTTPREPFAVPEARRVLENGLI